MKICIFTLGLRMSHLALKGAPPPLGRDLNEHSHDLATTYFPRHRLTHHVW